MRLNGGTPPKKMNGEKVPQAKVDQIVEAARLAPTSSGLQPFKVIVVTNQELKKKNTDCSFRADTDC